MFPIACNEQYHAHVLVGEWVIQYVHKCMHHGIDSSLVAQAHTMLWLCSCRYHTLFKRRCNQINPCSYLPYCVRDVQYVHKCPTMTLEICNYSPGYKPSSGLNGYYVYPLQMCIIS